MATILINKFRPDAKRLHEDLRRVKILMAVPSIQAYIEGKTPGPLTCFREKSGYLRISRSTSEHGDMLRFMVLPASSVRETLTLVIDRINEVNNIL